MELEELNEVGTLLHIMTEIATNHPGFPGIGRACQRRLNEIEADCKSWEADEAQANQRRAAERSTRDYVRSTDGSEKVVTPPEGPANSAVEEKDGSIRRLSTDKRSKGEKMLDQPVKELPGTSGAQDGDNLVKNETSAPVERRV